MTTPTYLPGTPNWVDLGTTDIPGAAAFYTPLFGWTHSDFGPEMGNYGMFLKNGKQVAGIGPASETSRGTSWATYFATDDADAVASKVTANGGKIIMAPMDVMDQGRMAVFADPSGSYFSVWQPGAHHGAEVVNEHGALTWNELMTHDIDRAKSFYPAVLGMSARDVPLDNQHNYTLLQVGDRAIAGAMAVEPDQSQTPQAWHVYFYADDPDEIYRNALDLGATPRSEPQDSPAGRFAWLSDPQGGTFAVIRSDPNLEL